MIFLADERRVIRTVLETGEATLGLKSALKRMKSAKLVIVSNNCKSRDELMEIAKKAGTRTHEFGGTSIELGEACRKPFPVSVMTVTKPGNAKLAGLK